MERSTCLAPILLTVVEREVKDPSSVFGGMSS